MPSEVANELFEIMFKGVGRPTCTEPVEPGFASSLCVSGCTRVLVPRDTDMSLGILSEQHSIIGYYRVQVAWLSDSPGENGARTLPRDDEHSCASSLRFTLT